MTTTRPQGPDLSNPVHPFYDAPDLAPVGENGHTLTTPDGIALTLGSDLLLTLGKDPDTGAWMIHAHDSSGNWLTTLATVPEDQGGHAAALQLLPMAADTARALFPNFLFINSDPKATSNQ